MRVIGTASKESWSGNPNGTFMAVDPIVSGDLCITEIQQFVMDHVDPVNYGFVVRRTSSSCSIC